jgi:hypothetical protein
MADEEDGALVLHQHLLEEFEGIGVKVIGGFVHYQYVRRFGEKPCQQRPVSLAA